MTSSLTARNLVLFTVAVLQPMLFGQARDRINGHLVVLDTEGKLLAWVNPQTQAYGRVMSLGWNFL